MIKRKDLLEQGSDKLVEQREAYKELRHLSKAASKEFEIEEKHILQLKDYVHYAGMDWDDDPLNQFEQAEWRDKLAQPFRKILSVINILKETGRLDLLDKILKSLEMKGIVINITDDIKFKSSDKLMPYIDAMSDLQTTICSLADERKEFRQESKAIEDSTPVSYNKYVATLASYKIAKEKGKKVPNLEDKLQKLILDNGIDRDVFGELRNDIKE